MSGPVLCNCRVPCSSAVVLLAGPARATSQTGIPRRARSLHGTSSSFYVSLNLSLMALVKITRLNANATGDGLLLRYVRSFSHNIPEKTQLTNGHEQLVDEAPVHREGVPLPCCNCCNHSSLHDTVPSTFTAAAVVLEFPVSAVGELFRQYKVCHVKIL